jgi:hypothetical protein
MKDQIQLPPHPYPARIDPAMRGNNATGAWIALWNVKQMDAYAREAVIADRKARQAMTTTQLSTLATAADLYEATQRSCFIAGARAAEKHHGVTSPIREAA